MKAKKFFKTAAIVCGVLALSVSFAACSGGGDTGEVDEGETPSETQQTHDPVTLEVTGSPGTYEPHNFVDGECTMCDETTIFSQDSVARDDIVTQESDEQGTVQKITYTTDAYPDYEYAEEGVVTKTAYVYLPYGYDAEDTATKYNVLYLLHGKGLNEEYWFAQGSEEDGSQYYPTSSIYQSGGNGTANLLDTMIKNGDAEKTIIVTPTFYLPGEDGATDSSDEVMEIGMAGFSDELRNDLMPYIAANYNTYAEITDDMTAEQIDDALKANRGHQGYAGLSMGAMASYTIVWTECLDYFSYIGTYSGGTTLDDAAAIVELANTVYAEDDIGYWYVGLGTSETSSTYPGDPFGCYRTLLAGIDRLQSGSDLSAGDNCQFVLCNNTGHNYQSWITALYNSMQVFFKA